MKTLNKINYTIEDSFIPYDEYAYYNNIDIVSKGVDYISHEESLSIISELGYNDYEPQFNEMLSKRKVDEIDSYEQSFLQEYMTTKEDKQ